jgi:hypothetical protein
MESNTSYMSTMFMDHLEWTARTSGQTLANLVPRAQEKQSLRSQSLQMLFSIQ